MISIPQAQSLILPGAALIWPEPCRLWLVTAAGVIALARVVGASTITAFLARPSDAFLRF